MDEAAATLVGIVGAELFQQKPESQIRQRLNQELARRMDVVYCHKRLVELAGFYAAGQINFQTYESEKQRLAALLNRNASNAAMVAFEHTYSYYFPLMCRLFYALDGNLARFVKVIKEAPRLPESLDVEVAGTGKIREITGFELHRYFETRVLEPYFEAMIKNPPKQ